MTIRIKLLLVDDEPEVLNILREFLTDLGHRVTCASNGRKALAILAAEPFDLLISDIRMPDISGTSLAMQATQQHPGLRVILMSGYAPDRETRWRLLSKPFRMKLLKHAIEAEFDPAPA